MEGLAMKILATNRSSGEVVSMEVATHKELINAWRIAQEYAKVSDSLKAQLKELVPTFVGEKGVSEPVDGYIFRISNIQRKTYDKAVLRQELDEDTLDLLLKPDKPAVDKFLKENLERLGESSTRIRKAMVDEGKPYQVIKLEKLDRD